jgi:hypothetical protein
LPKAKVPDLLFLDPKGKKKVLSCKDMDFVEPRRRIVLCNGNPLETASPALKVVRQSGGSVPSGIDEKRSFSLGEAKRGSTYT